LADSVPIYVGIGIRRCRFKGETMSLEKDVSSVLQQYAADTGVYSIEKVERDFVRVTQELSTEHVTNGLSEALRSEQTPPFDQVVGQSFEHGDDEQRAGMLNQLLDGAGPAVVKQLIESGVLQGGQSDAAQEQSVTPELAGQLHPDLIQQVAREAHQEDPAVIDRMSKVYAEDADLGATLGGGTLSVVMSKIAENR
jgi:hypothetical protein